MKHAPTSPFEPGTGADTFGFSAEGDFAAELGFTRMQFGGLDELQKDLLDPYATMLISDELAQVAGHVRPSDYLAESDDRGLGVFLDRHHAYLDAQRADPYLTEVFEHFRSSYLDRLETGIAEGWVSDDARDMFPVIEAATLHIGDMRDTRLEWIVGRFTGYNNMITIAQGIGNNYREEVVSNLYHSSPHELSHRFSRWLPRWASESLSEQLGLVVQHGEPTVFHADLRQHEKSAFYNAETALMHTVLTAAPKQNQELPLLALRAFTSNGPDSNEWKQFHTALDNAWGTPDVFRKVSNCVDGLEKVVAAEHEDWNNWLVEPEASTRTMNLLLHDQARIFGSDYRPPARHRREPTPSAGPKRGGRHRRD